MDKEFQFTVYNKNDFEEIQRALLQLGYKWRSGDGYLPLSSGKGPNYDDKFPFALTLDISRSSDSRIGYITKGDSNRGVILNMDKEERDFILNLLRQASLFDVSVFSLYEFTVSKLDNQGCLVYRWKDLPYDQEP